LIFIYLFYFGFVKLRKQRICFQTNNAKFSMRNIFVHYSKIYLQLRLMKLLIMFQKMCNFLYVSRLNTMTLSKHGDTVRLNFTFWLFIRLQSIFAKDTKIVCFKFVLFFSFRSGKPLSHYGMASTQGHISLPLVLLRDKLKKMLLVLREL